MDWFWYALIGLVLGSGTLASIGNWFKKQAEQRREDRLERERGPRPICGCEHHLALHDPKTNECHGTNTVTVDWTTIFTSGKGTVEKPIEKAVSCTCRQYVGPQPLTQYYAPEISGETGGS